MRTVAASTLDDAGSGNPDAPILDIDGATTEIAIRCTEGDNPLTLAVTDANGTSSTALDVVEDQAIVVGGQY